MITFRRAAERNHDRSSKQEVWNTFHGKNRVDALAHGFGNLARLDEGRLPPCAGVPPYPLQDAEIVTYVRAGTLLFEDSMGHSGVIHAGEFQRMTAGRGIHYSETNASRTGWAHVFQIWLHPSKAALEPGHEQRRFSIAQRRGVLCLVASPGGQLGSLQVHQEVLIYSTITDHEQHLVHELAPGRSGWLHVVDGAVTLGDLVLRTGDGAGVTTERSLAFTTAKKTEILLLDLGAPPPGISQNRGGP